MTAAALGSLFHYVFLAGCALTAGKLYFSGLYKRYPVFFLYFLFRIPNAIWPFFLDVRSVPYFNVWTITTIIALIFYVLLVVELYRLVLANYRGLQTIGRWAMYASLIVSVAVSVLSLLPKMASMSARNRKLFVVLGPERAIETALALFIIVLLAFLSRYPIQLSRNVRLHAVVYAAFFLSNTLGTLMRLLFGIAIGDAANLVIAAVNTSTVLAWLLFLNPAGEEVRDSQPAMTREHEQRLLKQLETLNATMLRVSRQAR